MSTKYNFGIDGFEMEFNDAVDEFHRAYLYGYSAALRKFFSSGVSVFDIALMLTEAAVDQGVLKSACLHGAALVPGDKLRSVANMLATDPKDGQG